MVLYFIRAILSHRVKIGVSEHWDARLSKLRREGADDLEVLKVFPGSLELEKEVHGNLAAYRHHGEWFEDCPQVRAEIARLEERHVDFANTTSPESRGTA